MAIVYLYAEDEKHYTKTSIDRFKKKYKTEEIKVAFVEEDAEKIIIESLSKAKDYFIITPLYFHLLISKYSSFIRVIRLSNENGILTSQDVRLGIKAEEKLKSKLNSSITKPTVTFDNYGGAKELREETNSINSLFKLGMPVKGIFLAGMPGTGKSFFAKCLAGELNRYLIELSLTKFMKSSNSILLIEEFFDFFKTNPGDYIIWLDEIEKMFVGDDESTQLLGTLLTKINEFNSISSTIKSTAFIVATANNVLGLSKRNPEFFRNGRFDMLLALNSPTDEGAREIFGIYKNANRKKSLEIITNSIYLEVVENVKITSNEKSLLKEISKYTEINKKAIFEFINEKEVKNKKDFYNKIQNEKESYFTISFLKDMDDFIFDFEINQIISKTFNKYRDKCQDMVRFPYSPAEIEYFVTCLFKHYLFMDINIEEKNIDSLIEKIKPLQVSMKDQLTEMAGVISDFRQI